MRKLYQSTYYFWILTKLAFAIGGFLITVSELGKDHLAVEDKKFIFLGTTYTLLLLSDVILSFNGKYYRLIKYLSGITSLIIAVVLSGSMLVPGTVNIPFPAIFFIWFFLSAIFDLMVVKQRKHRVDLVSNKPD